MLLTPLVLVTQMSAEAHATWPGGALLSVLCRAL